MSQLKIFFTLFSISILLFLSCKYPDIPKHLEIRDYLQLDYAPYLRKTEKLHPQAAIGLQNKYRDVYYLVVPHPWKSDSAYVQYLYDSLANDLKNISRHEDGLHETIVLSDTSYVNDKDYYVQDLILTGVMKDQKLIFNMQLIQKDTFLYQTSGWLFLSKKDLWFDDIVKMNNSLIILDGKN
ncbi:MAG TPA: hypothetical protein VFD65_01270 [Chitinophagales bacterium]|nr:hypothetical protein [Chitinophagales bacterium]